MESIKIKGAMYPIKAIVPADTHVLQVIFEKAMPSEWDGDIELYTNGDILATTLSGWTTVYREDGQTVYLSDNGSVYTPPAEVEPGPVTPSEPYVPSLEELQAAKKSEISRACEEKIYSGMDVTLADGTTEPFSLTEHDQLNLFGKQVQLAAGVEQLEYHADGQPCRYYTAADMQTIVTAAMTYVSYHTTYCNALNMWINGVQTSEDLDKIYYGATVPEAYQSDVLKAYIAKTDA